MSDAQRWQRWCETYLKKARLTSNDRLEACCPVHDDRTPSLGVNLRTGWADCHAGSCGFSGALHELAQKAGLPVEGAEFTPAQQEPEATYTYRTAIGASYHQVVRRPGKKFSQRRWTGAGWEGKAPAKTLPYNLDKLAKAKASEPVVWVEGEKDADRAAGLKLLATTSPGGAEGFGKLDPATLAVFEGRRVLVLPDNDPPGRRYTLRVVTALRKAGADPRILDLAHHANGVPAPLKFDLSKWLDAGGTKKRLLELAKEAFAVSLDLEAWRSLVKLEELLGKHGEPPGDGRLNANPPEPWETDPRVKRWALPACPWNRSHSWSSQVLWYPSGQVEATCDSCPAKDWADLQHALTLPPPGDSGDTVTDPPAKHAGERLRTGAPPALTPGDSGDNWPDPIPLDPSPAVSSFPVEALPPRIGAYVEAVAEALQAPVDLVAAIALGVLSATVAKKFEVVLMPDWVESANLYLLAAADVAERKSAVLAELRAPLQLIEDAAVKVAQQARRDRCLRREVVEAELTVVKRKGGAQVEKLLRELAELEDKPDPRLTADNVTLEKAAELMAANGGRLAILSAEGHLLKIAGGHYSRGEVMLGVLLPGYSRGESYREDRLGRPSVYIKDPTLTLCICPQPSVLRDLLHRKEFWNIGFVPRFWMFLPPSRVGERLLNPPPIPSALREEWHSLVATLAGLNEPAEGEEVMPTRLGLSTQARALFDCFRSWREREVRRNGSLYAVRSWAERLAGNTARVALLLHLASNPDPQPGTVPEATMAQALKVAAWAIDHGRAVFDLGSRSGGHHLAEVVLTRLLELQAAEGTWGHFRVRDLHRKLQRQVDSSDALRTVLDHLAEDGWVRSVEPKAHKPQAYCLHPRACELARVGDRSTGEQDRDWLHDARQVPLLPPPRPSGRLLSCGSPGCNNRVRNAQPGDLCAPCRETSSTAQAVFNAELL